jgi:hypothetical protein
MQENIMKIKTMVGVGGEGSCLVKNNRMHTHVSANGAPVKSALSLATVFLLLPDIPHFDRLFFRTDGEQVLAIWAQAAVGDWTEMGCQREQSFA